MMKKTVNTFYVLFVLGVLVCFYLLFIKTNDVEITNEVVVNEDIGTIIFEEPVIEEPVVCIQGFIPAYKGKLDMSKYGEHRLQDYKYLNVMVKLSQDFIDNYKYEDSDKFFFGLKVFVGNHTDNGGYYNVLRTRSLSVASRNYLTGLVTAKDLSNGFTWTIPLQDDIYLANSEFVEGKQFIKTNLSKYFNEDGTTKIGAYLSSTKELKGWELGDISIELCK